MFKLTKLAVLTSAIALAACNQTTPENDTIWPKVSSVVTQDDTVESRVASILKSMTLEQKVAQMIQPEIRDISVEDMRKYGFGSYLNGGGAYPNNNKHATVNDWVQLAEAMYQASIDDTLDGSKIPTMWGTDAVHGHNNVIGATIFPHNIGLGAANNPKLINEIAKATAKEVAATGIDWVFAPTVAVARDDRWGRTYESYSEDPSRVKAYAGEIVSGLQGEYKNGYFGEKHVISTVKHFIGDGGTQGGDDQGNNIDSEAVLAKIHGQGYFSGLQAGAQTVMASFNSWNGDKIHGNSYLLTEVLKNKLGFDGLVVGDWNGHGQVEGCSNQSCAQAINAGVDIIMVPTDWQAFYSNTLQQVRDGIISAERIDDAVTRILRVKVRAGLFDKANPAARPYANKNELIGAQAHRDIAAEAVRSSLVLLKNNQQVLPLNPNSHILVAGDGADNIGKQSGGWSITWQGTNNTNADFPGGTSILDGIKQQVSAAGGSVEFNLNGEFTQKPAAAIVVFGEEPYAEGHGDLSNVNYQANNKTDLALLKRLKQQGIPVVSVFLSGRPMWVNAELNASDAFVAAWLPGSEGHAVSQVLFKDKAGKVQYDFTASLPFSWPNDPFQQANLGDADYAPLFKVGYGLSYKAHQAVANDLDETFKNQQSELTSVSLFNGEMKAPWHMWLVAGAKTHKITANSMQVGALNYRTIDKTIQEDARRIVLDGSETAGVQIASNHYFRENLQGLAIDKTHLVLDVKVDAMSDKPIMLNMNCESEGDAAGSCRGAIDIAPTLQQAKSQDWRSVSMPLSCMQKQGVDFSKIVVPFEMLSDGQLDISFANIRYSQTLTENSLTVTCP